MKTKRTFLSILTLCIALLFTACSGKGTADTEKSQNTKTESGSESADDSNSKLNDLYQQEKAGDGHCKQYECIYDQFHRIFCLQIIDCRLF